MRVIAGGQVVKAGTVVSEGKQKDSGQSQERDGSSVGSTTVSVWKEQSTLRLVRSSSEEITRENGVPNLLTRDAETRADTSEQTGQDSGGVVPRCLYPKCKTKSRKGLVRGLCISHWLLARQLIKLGKVTEDTLVQNGKMLTHRLKAQRAEAVAWFLDNVKE